MQGADETGSRRDLREWILGRLSRVTSSGRFIPQMDGLRFVAIAMVIMYHLNGYLSAKSVSYRSGSGNSPWFSGVAGTGFHGVELFFVISGFILALPFAGHYLNGTERVDLKKYYLRRLTRLEPPYFVTVLALFVLAVWVRGRSAATLLPHLGASLFYLHNLIYGSASSVVGVAWSLEIEVQFYVLVPLLTLIFAVRDWRWRRALLAALMLSATVAQRIWFAHNARASLSVLGYLQFFLAGFLLADIFLRDWQERPRASWYWDAVSVVGWPLMFVVFRSEAVTNWIFVWLVLLLYCAAFRGAIGQKVFSNAWITAAGGMCYSIYLIHYEVISAVGRYTDRIHVSGPAWVIFGAQLAMVGSAILVVCGFYFLILEKPCMRRDWWKQWRRTAPPDNDASAELIPVGAAQ